MYKDWRYKSTYPEFSELIGQKIIKVEKTTTGDYDDNQMVVIETENAIYRMFHQQNCCESVYLEDVAGGELEDLAGSVVLNAEKSTKSDQHKNDYYGAQMWTFYHISTDKVTLTLRWEGTSNGYYSVNVSLLKQEKETV